MSAGEIHYDDIGTVFRITIKEGTVVQNINSATSKKIRFRSPKGVRKDKVANFTTDGSDGKIQYTTISQDLNELGSWEIQAYLVMPSWSGYSDVGSFEVHSNI